MKKSRRLASVLIAAALVAGASSPAWAYGVGGWPQGKPDHVIQAQAKKQARAKTAKSEAQTNCACDASCVMQAPKKGE
jgi:hypothetical protein